MKMVLRPFIYTNAVGDAENRYRVGGLFKTQKTMPQMINLGNELIRINLSNNRIEYSTDKGRNWNNRCSSSYAGTFIDLLEYENEILACTSKGIYYSTDKGRNWNSRCSSSYAGTFNSLQNNGNELLAITSKGLYYSKDKGRNWNKRS